MLFNRNDFILANPPFSKKWLSYAQSQAFYRMGEPIGDPFGGAAYGKYESDGFWKGTSEFISQAGKEISNAFAAIDKSIIQPVGHALESIGKQIANDPVTFIAQVAAVALAPATGGASLWALPVIQGASVAAHGGSFEDVIKSAAISAATVWAGGQISGYISSSMQTGFAGSYEIFGASVEKATAAAVANAVGYSSASAIGAAVQGKNASQIASIALASGVGAALPAVIGAIPGFNELVSGASGINATLGKAVQNSIITTAGALINSAITHTDASQAVVAGLIQSGINSIITTKNIVTDTFKQAGNAVGLNNLSNSAQAVVANTLTSVFGAAINGGNASNALSKAFMNVGIQAIGSIDMSTLNKASDKVNSLYNSVEQSFKAYTSGTEQYEGIAEERNALADQANEYLESAKANQQTYKEDFADYEILFERYKDENSDLSGLYDATKLAQDAYNKAKNAYEYYPTWKTQNAIDDANSLARSIEAQRPNIEALIKNPELDASYGSALWYLKNASNYNYAPDIANGQRMLEDAKNGILWQVERFNAQVKDYETIYLPAANAAIAAYQAVGDRVNAAAAELTKASTDYNNQYNLVSGLKTDVTSTEKELAALQASIAADQKKYNDAVVVVAEKDKALASLEKTLNDALNKYNSDYSAFQTASTELGNVSSTVENQINKKLVATLDPDFNEAEYKAINNLGPAVDAYNHWVTTGKNEGLYTNKAAAAMEIDQEYARLMKDFASQQGYKSVMEVPSEMAADLKSKLYSQYGDNIGALRNATAQTVVQQGDGASAEEYLQKYNPNNTADLASKQTYGQWNKPLDYKLPVGTKYATQSDVLSNRAYQSFDDKGNTVWLTNSGTESVRQYDAQTGDMVSKDIIVGEPVDVEVHATRITEATSIEDVDAYTAVEFFGSLQSGIVANMPDTIGNLNKQGIKAMAEGSKILLDYAKSTGSDAVYNIVRRGLDIGATGLAGLAQVVSAGASLVSLIQGTNPNDSAVMDIAKGVEGWSNAASSQEFKDASAKMEAAMKAANGGDVLGAIINNAKEFPVDFALKYIGTNLVSFLPGVGLGFAAAKGTTALAKLTSFSDDAVRALSAGTALTTQRAYEIAQEAGSNGLTAYNETRKILKDQNPSWTDEKLNDEAMNRARIVAGTAALTTLATQGLGLDKIAQNIMTGSGLSSSVMTTMLNRLISTVSETGGEALQSFVPTSMKELLLGELDPNRDSTKEILQDTFLGAIGGLGQAAAINTLQSVQDIPALYLAANGAFEAQLKATNYTMGELGVVLDQWVPKPASTAVGSFPNNPDPNNPDNPYNGINSYLRNQIIPVIFQSYPEYALPYKDATSFMEAVKNNLGVWEVTAADIVDTKFNNDVLTQSEATKLLSDSGLAGATNEDAVKANVIGLLNNNIPTKIADYVNKNMVSEAEAKAAAAQEGYDATKEELDAIIGRGVEADVIAKFVQTVDPKATSLAEATQFFRDAGYGRATAADIAQFVKSTPEAEMKAAVAAWVDPRQVTRNEAIDFFKSFSYVPTDTEINTYVVQGPEVFQDAIKRQIGVYVNPRYTTIEEVKAAAAKQGYNISDAEAQKFVGQKDQAQQEAAVESYSDPLAVLADEARQYFAQEGYTPTVEDLQKFTGQMNEADTAKLIYAYADPLVMTEAEARKYMADLSYTNPTAAEVAQFVKQAKEADMSAALQTYVDTHQVTRSEALGYFAAIGYVPTEAEINTYVMQGARVAQADVQKALGEYVDPRYVDANEVKEAFKSLGLSAPITQADLLRLSGQYAESELAGKATAALPIVAANAMYALFTGDPVVKSDLTDAIIQKMDEYQNLNMTRAEAQDAAIQSIATQLGTTKTAIESYVSTALKSYATKTDIQDAINGIDFPEGISKTDVYTAISDYMAANPSLTLEQVAAKIADATKNLATTAGVNTAIADALKVYATKNDIEKAISGIQFPDNLSKADVVSAIEQYMTANPGLSLAEVSAKIGEATKDLATTKGVESAISKALDGYATQKNISDATTSLQDAINAAQDGNTARFNDIDAAIKALKDAGLTTTQVQKIVNDNSTELSASFKSALADAAKGNTDALNSVKSGLEAKISDVQNSINGALSSQSDVLGEKIKTLMDQGASFQEATTKALAAIGVSVSDLGADFATRLSDVQTTVNAAIKGQTDEFGAKVKELMDQGATFQEATNAALDEVGANINKLGENFGANLSNVQAALEEKLGDQAGVFESRVKDLMDQGVRFQDATKESLASLGVNVADLGTDFASQLSNVQSGLSSALNDQSTAFNTKLAELMAKGNDYQTATELALKDVGVKIGDLGAQFETALDSTQSIMTAAIDKQSADFNARIKELVAQGATQQEATTQAMSDLGIKINELGSTVSGQYNDLTKQISGLSSELNSTEIRLTQLIAQNEASGLSRDVATQKAIKDLSTQLGTSVDALGAQIDTTSRIFNTAIESTKTDIANTKSDLITLIKANETAGASRDSATQKAVADLSAKLGVSEASLLSQIGATQAQLSAQVDTATQAAKQYTQEQVATATNEIKSQMQAYEQAGYTRDVATQLAISGVAQDLGTTKSDLLTRLGTTETTLTNLVQAASQAGQQYTQQQVQAATEALQNQIEANRQSGLDATAATNKAVSDLANQLGVSTSTLMSNLGTSVSQLQAQIQASEQSSQQYTQQQVANATKQLQTQMEVYEQAGYDRDTATQLAISTVAQDLGMTKTDLLAKMGSSEANLTQLIQASAQQGQAYTQQQVQAATAQLQAQIEANQKAGMDANAATNKAVFDLASQLGVSTSTLMSNLGTSVSQLQSQIEAATQASKQYTQQQVSAATAAIQQQMQANMDAGMASDAALQKAIGDVSANLGITSANLMAQMGTNTAQLQAKIEAASQAGQQYTQQQVQQATSLLQQQITANQNAGMDAISATNKAVADVASQLGTTATNLQNQIATSNTQLAQQIAAAQQASQQFTQQQVDNATAALQQQITANQNAGMDAISATNKAVKDVAAQLGTTETNLQNQIASSNSALANQIQQASQQSQAYTQQQVQQATTAIQQQMQANMQAGMESDAALQKAIADVAAQSNTSTANLLGKLGTTESALRTEFTSGINNLQNQIQNQMAAYEQAGYDRDTALSLAISGVAQDLGTTRSGLLSQIGATESTLLAKITESQQAGQAYTQQQVQQATTAIQQQMQANMDAGMASDAALQKAIADVAAQSNTSATNLLSQIGKTEANLRTEFTSGLTDVKNSILAKVAEYQQQGYNSDQALQAAIDTVSQSLGKTRGDLLSQMGTTETQLRNEITTQVSATEQRLADLIAKNETEGMQRDQATQAAINTLTGELGTTRSDLLSKIDLTSQQFQNEITIAKTDLTKQMTVYGQQTQQQIADTKAQIQSQMQAYQQANMDADTALSLAISGVAQDLGVSRSDLLAKIGTTETNLRTELTAQTQALSTQVQDVAKLLGKPASQVTANDITMVQNMIAGTQAVNLGYDVNRDNKVDTADLQLIQQQQQIQQQQNVTAVTNPTTGEITYVDKTTGAPVTGFDVTGTQWGSSGIYQALEQQKSQQAAMAKAQAAQTKQAQQKNQFGQLMNLLFQAPDAAGQSVSVKTPDPSKINYIYDWSSIFATPSQASLMPSPYGPMNTVMPQQPQQKQQASNQPLFQLASGFASGGIVGGSDIEVGGGGSIDDLINILKGNG